VREQHPDVIALAMIAEAIVSQIDAATGRIAHPWRLKTTVESVTRRRRLRPRNPWDDVIDREIDRREIGDGLTVRVMVWKADEIGWTAEPALPTLPLGPRA
jgi:hypothetical protein